MKIVIAADHGGYKLKEFLKEKLIEEKYDITDIGTYSTESVSYAQYGLKAATMVASGEFERGIVICGTGIGISIAANKVKGIRCAHCENPLSAKLTRNHNNANMIALGGRITGEELALDIIHNFLTESFDGGRHEIRVNQIKEYEEK